MYRVMKIIYDSALRDMLLNEDQKVIDNVLPYLAAYEALLIIKNIFDTKEAERKRRLKNKQEREELLKEHQEMLFRLRLNQLNQRRKSILTLL
jgi:hypothetical protein